MFIKTYNQEGKEKKLERLYCQKTRQKFSPKIFKRARIFEYEN